MKKVRLAFAVSLLFIMYSCNSNPVIPKELQPGRRDYVWSVDTIKIFSNYIHGIWGSSPTNVWGVGPGGALNTTIWHYDGRKWKTDGISRDISPNCIYGFAEDDVWIAGGNGKIWHYDGKDWSQNYQHTMDGFTGIDLYDLYGTSNHDLYAVGIAWFTNEKRRGIILHYDGSQWEQKYLANSNSYFYKIRNPSNGETFIYCIRYSLDNSQDTTLFYELTDDKLEEIYTDVNKSIKQGWISIIEGKVFFSFSNTIYKYEAKSLKELFKTNSKYYTPTLFGRNEKDMFLGTSEGIEHFNGTNTQLLLTGEGWATGGLLFDSEVFFLKTASTSGSSLIYHGKLKQQ